MSASLEKIICYDTSYLICFLFGIMSREIYTFIKEGGLNGQFPLSKSLFYMFLCIVGFALLALPHFYKLRKTSQKLEDLLDKLNTPERPKNVAETKEN